ncbi:hypothetical protein CMI47_11875 [Candidatus Pacearchaeota archaeon]|nr:hypothetical protein [Candidatus Pacearchaeota archaeon]
MAINDDAFIKEIFGLNETNIRTTHKLANKDKLYSAKKMEQDELFHVYTNPGFLDGNSNCHILIPKDQEILSKIRPDRLQWFELYGFFNLLSTIDLSLSVPFIEIKWRDYNPADEAFEKKQEIRVLKNQGERTLGDVINDPSLYFQPQTYYKNAINKFRPFLAIKSFDVEIKIPIGMIATKYATLQLTLFDITKLAKARDFIYPGDRAPTLEITYGWSHPYGTKTFQSRFINNLRDTAMWRVANYSVSINQDNTANITLELFSLAAHKIVRTNLIPEKSGIEQLNRDAKNAQVIKEKELEKLNKELNKNPTKKRRTQLLRSIQELTKDSPSLDIINDKKLSVKGRSNISKKIIKYNKKLAKGTKKHLNEFFNRLFFITEVEERNRVRKGRRKKSSNNHIVAEYENWIKKNGLEESFSFITRRRETKNGKRGKIITNNPRTYLGLLLMYIFGVCIPRARNEHENVETQLIFYNFNANSLRTKNKNISSFIIHNSNGGQAKRRVGFVDQINRYILKTKILNPPIHDIFSIINRDYLSNPINLNFGWDPDFFNLKKVRIGKNEDGTPRFKYIVDSAGEKYYNMAKEIGFIQPSIKMYIVEGPAADKENTIIRRVFIYDEAEKTNETELLALRKRIDENNDIGTIEQSYQEVRSEIPFVQVGTERTIVKNVTLNTINDPMLQTIFMQRIAPSTNADNTEQQKHLPAQFLPMTAEIETYGFPNIMFGSKLFIDLRTNTTVDNIYRIIGVRHSFTPSAINTKLSLTPDDAWLHIKTEDEQEE